MADLRLKRVTLRNWGKFRSADIQFPEYGLVMVSGINAASGGAMQSVGSGKTIFGESFSRALFGIKGRFKSDHLKYYSRDKKGDTYVCVEADLLGKPLKVEMGYMCEEINPRAEGLRFSYDGGKDVERGLLAQTRAELVKLLGVTPLLAQWTVFVNGQRMDFSQLEQEQSVELVMSALRQPPWSAYHENVKAYVRKFNRIMTADETKHEQAQERVKEAQADVDIAQTELDEEQANYTDSKQHYDESVKLLKQALNALSKKMEPLDKRQKELDREMKRLEEEKAAAHHALEIRQREIQERIRTLKVSAKPLLEKQNVATRAATAAQTNYTNYRDAKRTCPTCKRPMGEGLDQNHLKELERAYEKALKAEEAAAVVYTDALITVEGEEEQLEVATKEINALGVRYGITKFSEEYESNDAALSELSAGYDEKETKLEKLGSGPSRSVLDAAKAKLEERKRVLQKANAALEIAAESLAVSQSTQQVLNYWNTAFSPYGIPNMVLREALAPLNHEAKRISAAMTGGTIEVVYSTTRELSSGLEKAKLNIAVNNLLGSQDLEGSSKGESGLTNYIVSETLSNVGQVSRRVGYRWYDEIVPHQDPKVCHSIYAYWKELAQKLKILIMMVDHNPVAANYADYFLVIQKSGKPKDVVGTVNWR